MSLTVPAYRPEKGRTAGLAADPAPCDELQRRYAQLVACSLSGKLRLDPELVRRVFNLR